MRTAFIITASLVGVLIAYGYPFVAILRGKRVLRTVGIGWGLVFLYIAHSLLSAPYAGECL